MRITLIILALFCSMKCHCQIHKAQAGDLQATISCYELTQNAKDLPEKNPAVSLHGTEVRQLNSKIIDGMEYQIYVSLPDNYESSTESYPVLYFLDAWAQFGIIRQTYWLLRFYDEVPPLIIVGIAYEGSAKDHLFYRSRDYSPTRVPKEKLGQISKIVPTSGGAPDFVRFLEKELFPMIEKEYRVNKSDRALFGVSFGGLCSTYVLFKHNHLFQRYFIGSPSLWWDNEIIFKYEEDYAKNNASLPVKVFLAAGGKENLSIRYNKLRDRLLSRNYNDLDFTSTIFENETHMSFIAAAHTRALRVLYNSEE